MSVNPAALARNIWSNAFSQQDALFEKVDPSSASTNIHSEFAAVGF
jgi:hypothetical protein